MPYKDITVIRLWNAQSVAAGTTVYCDFDNGVLSREAIDIGDYAQGGTLSLQYTITGDGTLTIGYLLSNDGTNFVQSTGGHAIGTTLTKTSGYSGDGKDVLVFTPDMARFMKIFAWETGGADPAVITAHLAVQ